MTHTIDLSPDLEIRLEAEAAKRRIPTDDYLRTLVESSLPPVPSEAQPKTGAELVAALERAGIIGMWADREEMRDSTEYVNRLRRSIEAQALEKQIIPGSRSEE